MTKSAYVLMLGFAGACTVGFVACGGGSDTVSNTGAGGEAATGGATGQVTSTGGKSQVGGSAAGIGGSTATGGSAMSLPTGGAATGGASGNTGGTSSATGGAAATGGATGAADLEQTCIDVCKLLEGRTTPLACVPADCAGTCDVTYTKLYKAVPACGNDYLAMLKCGATQPADSWSCFTASSGTASISIPVPPSSAATDPCFTQFQKLYLTIIQNYAACSGALQ